MLMGGGRSSSYLLISRTKSLFATAVDFVFILAHILNPIFAFYPAKQADGRNYLVFHFPFPIFSRQDTKRIWPVTFLNRPVSFLAGILCRDG
jgi:hypothetical protein